MAFHACEEALWSEENTPDLILIVVQADWRISRETW